MKDEATGEQRLAQVLDVEAIVNMVTQKKERPSVAGKNIGAKVKMKQQHPFWPPTTPSWPVPSLSKPSKS